MVLDGRIIYRSYRDPAIPEELPNVMAEQVVGLPRRAVVFHHWRGEWVFDPLTLHETIMADSADGERRLTTVDRQTAERTARSFGQELPSETELRSMMEAGAAEMYATDDVMKGTPLPGEPGWPGA